MHKAAPPFAYSKGIPSGVRIAFVGEAWGEKEDILKHPFVGPAGRTFADLLIAADMAPPLPRNRDGTRKFIGELEMREWWFETCAERNYFLTNVFAFRPPMNSIPALCCAARDLPDDNSYILPPIEQGKYLRPEYISELDRLKEELLTVKPNLIVPLGATACWALWGSRAIRALRGAVTRSSVDGIKSLPTYHPQAVGYNFSLYPIVVADFRKAGRECDHSEVRRTSRALIVDPTLEEVVEWCDYQCAHALMLAVDIETFKGQISMIGFAASPTNALTIPFLNKSRDDWCYWQTLDEEKLAWRCVKRLLLSPAAKLFQNGLYDLQYLLRAGFRPRNCLHDTMILHHARYPELEKGLGFLASIYCDEVSWKLARNNASNKREE